VSRTYKLLVAVFALACLVAVALEADWAGVAWAVLATIGWIQTLVLASGLAPSALGCNSVLHSALQSVGASSLAVAQFYRDAPPQNASTILTVAGFALLAISLFMGRRGSTRVSTEAGVSTRGS